MCLIVCAWRVHPDFPLILAANRDEFYARPAEPMATWQDRPELLAGRDVQAGGSWLGITRAGRLAAVTNYRERPAAPAARSRGSIVTDFADSDRGPLEFAAELATEQYAGYSLLACDADSLVYASNRGDAPQSLSPGLYGLSNAALDTPWNKLTRSRERLGDLLNGEPALDPLLDLMLDKEPAADDDPALPFARPIELTAPFVITPDYGTRCTTAIIGRADGHLEVAERRFEPGGEWSGESRFAFVANAWQQQT